MSRSGMSMLDHANGLLLALSAPFRAVFDTIMTCVAGVGFACAVGFGRRAAYLDWRRTTAEGPVGATARERSAMIWHYFAWIARMNRLR